MSPPLQAQPLPPGSTIGIVGGGQLGRMAALAAARLGYLVHIFSPEANGPAAQVSAAATVADYTDQAAMEAFASAVDVVTFEFENIPAESVRLMAEHAPVRPCWSVLEVAQDRLAEKSFFTSLGIATAPFRAVGSLDELTRAVVEIGRPAVLKTARLGYDGKGQVKIGPDTNLAEAWAALGAGLEAAGAGVLEGFIDFEGEISVIVARGVDGGWAAFNPVWNIHRDHILHTTTVPAPISAALGDQAMDIARRAAEALGVIGLLAVEMFVTRDGRMLVNEMAPRPHNSGHWTMDACVTDQFEQFIRAVCGLPLGSPERHSDAEMKNLIGDEVGQWLEILSDPSAKLHLYGKAEARPGRKMGHVNRTWPLGSRGI